MAIKDVDTKCYILALFIRSDGERFLLGSGRYEFVKKQMHFSANTIANDVVEIQGNDGYLLAGQVRRPGTQNFDGYVGTGTTSKTDVESYRRAFFKFFRKNFLYKVIYVFPDGSAIQRKRGFLVDAPTVQELYQMYPEYHVALNFEDINYYYYNEDADGNEIYGKSALIGLSIAATGGLIWDALGAVSIGYTWSEPVEMSGSEIVINNQLNMKAPITDLTLKGDTFQQTYSGNNLFDRANAKENTVLKWVDANDSSEQGSIAGSNHISVAEGDRYTSNYAMAVFFYDSSDNYIGVLLSNGTVQKSTGAYVKTFVVPSGYNIAKMCIEYRKGQSGNPQDMVSVTGIMCNSGSSVLPYEPYVGGLPSPNPDYPQDINVVTGEQTVEVHGKNLLNKSTMSWGYIRSSDGVITGTTVNGTNITSDFIPVIGNKQYTASMNDFSSENKRLSFGFYTSNKTWISIDAQSTGSNTSRTTTTPQNCAFIRVQYTKTGGFSDDDISNAKFQFESGSSATTYDTYQGIVTYTVDLGSTELCKIGTYQDYIYKSGDDWYVHKDIGKYTFDGTESWQSGAYGTNPWILSNVISTSYDTSKIQIMSEVFRGVSNDDRSTSGNNVIYTTSNVQMYVRNTSITTLAGIQSATNGTDLYYALATATDTKITDNTLIGQLEALGAMKLFVGENNLTVSPTSTNLPAILDFKYYTAVSSDGIGYEWEPGEAGGSKVIMIDSIDDVYPLLTITGPAVNPIITNITTGSIFKYNGTVTSSQVLKVDMMNKTATLNGASVIGNVSQDWLYFKPGDNRVEYTTTNSDSPKALIEWQEIVG